MNAPTPSSSSPRTLTIVRVLFFGIPLAALVISSWVSSPQLRPIEFGLVGGLVASITYFILARFQKKISLAVGVAVFTQLVFFQLAKDSFNGAKVALYVQYLATFLVVFLAGVIVTGKKMRSA